MTEYLGNTCQCAITFHITTSLTKINNQSGNDIRGKSVKYTLQDNIHASGGSLLTYEGIGGGNLGMLLGWIILAQKLFHLP